MRKNQLEDAQILLLGTYYRSLCAPGRFLYDKDGKASEYELLRSLWQDLVVQQTKKITGGIFAADEQTLKKLVTIVVHANELIISTRLEKYLESTLPLSQLEYETFSQQTGILTLYAAQIKDMPYGIAQERINEIVKTIEQLKPV